MYKAAKKAQAEYEAAVRAVKRLKPDMTVLGTFDQFDERGVSRRGATAGTQWVKLIFDPSADRVKLEGYYYDGGSVAEGSAWFPAQTLEELRDVITEFLDGEEQENGDEPKFRKWNEEGR